MVGFFNSYYAIDGVTVVTFTSLSVCQAMPLCDEGNGFCRTTCHDWERETYGACGLHCKCCVPVVDGKKICTCIYDGYQ